MLPDTNNKAPKNNNERAVMANLFTNKDSTYEVGDFVRLYDHSGQPLHVIGRVTDMACHDDGDKFPVWLYVVATPDQHVYTGIPASRIATYGGYFD